MFNKFIAHAQQLAHHAMNISKASRKC